MSTVAFSSTGTLLNSSTIDDVVNTSVRCAAKITVVNSETATITHFNDPDLLRSVRVLKSSDGSDAPVNASGIVSITKASSSGTAVVFGAAAAGTYWVVIDN